MRELIAVILVMALMAVIVVPSVILSLKTDDSITVTCGKCGRSTKGAVRCECKPRKI